MNHTKHALRLALFVFWAIVVGILHSTSESISNMMRLGWPTQLMYLVVGAVVVYCGILFTKYVWNYK